MRDGRKWRSIPFVIFCSTANAATLSLLEQTHARIYPSMDPAIALDLIQNVVDEYQDKVLDDYQRFGILVRVKNGRAQIGPALKKRNQHVESEYYHPAGDRRNNRGWVTVKRDSEGIRKDLELFQILLDQGAGEMEMHRFFEEHPAILMEATMSIPLSHSPSFARPRGNKPDFALSPILGPHRDKMIGLMELKGPTEKNLTQGFHPGFTAKVHRAVDQVRDYARFLRDPANVSAILRAFGYIPDDPQLAVLIGRAPGNTADGEVWKQR